MHFSFKSVKKIMHQKFSSLSAKTQRKLRQKFTLKEIQNVKYYYGQCHHTSFKVIIHSFGTFGCRGKLDK
jgi:hypothetical protein